MSRPTRDELWHQAMEAHPDDLGQAGDHYRATMVEHGYNLVIDLTDGTGYLGCLAKAKEALEEARTIDCLRWKANLQSALYTIELELERQKMAIKT